MTPSGESNIEVSADLAIGELPSDPLDVRVRVEPGGRCAVLVILTGGATWRLALGPDGAAFVAGQLAAHAGVKFG